jgi:hypothetical protein
VTKLLKGFEERIWHFMPVQGEYGSPALDYVCCINGVFVKIETKRDAKHPMTPRQGNIAVDVMTAGGIVLLVYDQETLAEARAIIEEICSSERVCIKSYEDARHRGI